MAVHDSTYGAAMAAAYPRGRALRAADLAAWTSAAGPYLHGPVLDLGAGTGRFTAALATAVAPSGGAPGSASSARVVACEPSAAMRAAFPAGVAPLVGGSAEALPFGANTFRTVWASQMLHHVRDREAFAANVRRVLNPGGHLLIRGGFGDPERIPLYRYFPSAFPGHQSLLAGTTTVLAGAGLSVVTRIEVDQLYAAAPGELIAKVTSRSLSNLAALPDELFAEGVRRLTADAHSGALRFPVTERLDLIVFG